MIRPTPHSSTRIKGVRKLNTKDYIPDLPGFCGTDGILPINNGTEPKGESLVIDFESTNFGGTLLLRIQQAPPPPLSSNMNLQNDGASATATNSSIPSYFHGKKRRFQAVVRGRFRQPIPMAQTVTGQAFDRKAGNLPAQWMVNSFLQFITTLVPQLQVQLSGNNPRFLSPLVATAHTVLQHNSSSSYNTNDDDDNSDTNKNNHSGPMDEGLEEVHMSHPSSVVPLVYRALGRTVERAHKADSTSIQARMKARKRAMNQLAVQRDTTVQFDVTKEYTFEFYQHLLDFGPEGLAIDLGRAGGKVGIAKATDGQPLKLMSAWQSSETGEFDPLWSFDIWHESLYPYAQAAEERIHESRTDSTKGV
jgi:hypothetical protein